MDRAVHVRGFKEADLDACYAISLETGLAGGDASHVYVDPRLMGHIYVAPYALLDPTLAFVVEDGNGVAGFAVGTADTVAWEGRLEREWWPSLRARYADPAGVPPALQTPDQRRAFMIHHPTPTPAAVVARFPAHLHLNLLPRLQHQRIGSKLLDTWRQAASGRGTRATHVGVNRSNEGAIGFWRARGFEALALEGQTVGRTLWMGCGKQ